MLGIYANTFMTATRTTPRPPVAERRLPVLRAPRAEATPDTPARDKGK